MQETITYRCIMNLGFSETKEDDDKYFDDYGFNYSIIQKWLTDTIYLEWAKENQLCELIRIDNQETMNIMSCLKIFNLDHAEEMINFFSDKKTVVMA